MTLSDRALRGNVSGNTIICIAPGGRTMDLTLSPKYRSCKRRYGRF